MRKYPASSLPLHSLFQPPKPCRDALSSIIKTLLTFSFFSILPFSNHHPSPNSGGQYDIRAPVGASCAGYSHFVNVIEPTDGLYAMRCCQNSGDCVVSKSTYGVRVIFGEQWDWSGPHPDGLLPAAQGCVNGQLPGGGNGTVTIGVPSATATATSGITTLPIVSPTATVPVVNGTASSGVVGPTSTGGAGTKPTPTPSGNAAVGANKAAVVVSALLATAIGLFMA